MKKKTKILKDLKFVLTRKFIDTKLTMSHRKQTEQLDKLLGQVTSLRKATPHEYELKLKNFLIQRANHMRNGIFDGVKMPKIRRNIDGLAENLHQNQQLTQQAQVTTEKFLYAKSSNEYYTKELKDVAESLKKVHQIQKAMQSDKP